MPEPFVPSAPPRRCTAPGCSEFGVFPRGRCPEHERERQRENHKTRKAGHPQFYNAAGDRFKKYLIGCGNVVCQRVAGGVRCPMPMWGFHHIISPDQRPDLELSHLNVVGTCHGHHPRPGDEDQGVWVPTLWRPPMSGEPVPQWSVMPGQAPRPGQELWSLAERRARLA